MEDANARAAVTEGLQDEIEELRKINGRPFGKRILGYFKFMGPASMEAATTLGAGSFSSAVILGATFGYKMLWIPFYSYLFGLFMLFLGGRFAIYRKDSVLEMQNKYHTPVIGSFATGLVGCFFGMVVFSFGQYALGTDAIESAFHVYGINFPRSVNWIVIMVISGALSLMYGKSRKMVRIVEKAMQACIGIMMLGFLAVIFKTGINVPAMIKGILIPSVDFSNGVVGITSIIAGLSAAVAVGDWVQYHYSTRTRGYTKEHEQLAVADTVFGGLLPVTLVLSFVSIAFAETFAGKSGIPEDTTALANALMEVLPSSLLRLCFYLGVIAIAVSTMVGMSTVAAQSFCHALKLEPDPSKWYWKVGLLLPQIGFLGAFIGKPMMVVIAVAAMQSLFSWLSGASWYLLANDKRAMGKHCIKRYWINLGIIVSMIILNLIFVTFILSKMGVWD